jgi:hypothetical protein
MPPLDPACRAASPETYACQNAGRDLALLAITCAVLAVYTAIYWRAARLAWRDQSRLPLAHYKLSAVFVKVQLRYGRALFVAVFLSGVLLQAVSVGTCAGAMSREASLSGVAAGQTLKKPQCMSSPAQLVVLPRACMHACMHACTPFPFP